MDITSRVGIEGEENENGNFFKSAMVNEKLPSPTSTILLNPSKLRSNILKFSGCCDEVACAFVCILKGIIKVWG